MVKFHLKNRKEKSLTLLLKRFVFLMFKKKKKKKQREILAQDHNAINALFSKRHEMRNNECDSLSRVRGE